MFGFTEQGASMVISYEVSLFFSCKQSEKQTHEQNQKCAFADIVEKKALECKSAIVSVT